MKKLSVIVLALVLVVSLASVSFAATTSYAGEVAIQLSQGAFSTPTQTASFTIDLTKNYSDQLSAGLTLKGTESATLGLDTTGWIKFNYSPLVVTLKKGVGGNVQKDLDSTDVAFCALASSTGVQVDYTGIKGVTVTAVVNAPVSTDFNYLVKGVYSANGLTLGGGYQADGVDDAVDGYASLALGPITVGGEYSNRLVAKTTGILGTLSATLGPISANAKVIMLSAGFKCVDTGDAAGYSAYDNLRDGAIAGGLGIHADATYKLTDALSVNGNFETAEGSMSYLGGATYKLSDALSVGASYKALDATNAINVTVTDTLAAGLTGTLSLDMSPSAGTKSYTAKVDAVL